MRSAVIAWRREWTKPWCLSRVTSPALVREDAVIAERPTSNPAASIGAGIRRSYSRSLTAGATRGHPGESLESLEAMIVMALYRKDTRILTLLATRRHQRTTGESPR